MTGFDEIKHEAFGYLAQVQAENDKYREPCAEFLKFRELLDGAGIPWHDATDSCDYFTMHRTHGDGFSVIYGKHGYGASMGLLEARIDGRKDVDGWLTAEQAFELVKEVAR